MLGRNGVGKTTLLRTIMGLTDKATGTLFLDGADLTAAATHERARAGIGYVPQGRQIIPDFSVRENILMGGFAAQRIRPQDPRDRAGAVSLPDGESRPAGRRCSPAGSSSSWRWRARSRPGPRCS